MAHQLIQDNEIDVLGIKVKNLTWKDAFASVSSRLVDGQSQHLFAFLNANNANISMKDDLYRKSLSRSIVLPDGVGIDIAAKITDRKTFSANLNGTDFIPSLLVYFEKPLTIALLGGSRKNVEKAAEKFALATPWHNFKVISDGYFGDERRHEVLSKLKETEPDILLVAMGSPLQEKWVIENILPDHGKLVFTVGALFDFISHQVPRAPENWRRMRLEWLYRLLVEPRRLWRRYIIGNPLFIWHVLRHHFSGKTADNKDI